MIASTQPEFAALTDRRACLLASFARMRVAVLLVVVALSGGVARAEMLPLLHANVQDVFNDYGVQITSPHYPGDPADPKVVPKARWHQAPAKPQD